MTYHTLDDWLDEVENFATRRERFDADLGGLGAVLTAWLETAWHLGGEAERWEIECNKDMKAGAESNIRELLTAHGVPLAAFIDDNVANAIAQRNILAECLLSMRAGASQDRAASIDAAIAKAYPSGVELRLIGDAVARHLKSLVDEGALARKGE